MREVYASLYAGDTPPAIITDFILCSEIYHCTPKELDEQDAERILDHIMVFNAREEVRKMDIEGSQNDRSRTVPNTY
jgi:hypothetical protein